VVTLANRESDGKAPEILWRRKEAVAPLCRVATISLKTIPKPAASRTLSTYGRHNLSKA
jgi:hypothetical protein